MRERDLIGQRIRWPHQIFRTMEVRLPVDAEPNDSIRRDIEHQGIPVPRQLVTSPNCLLPGLDGRAEFIIPTTP
ncbi:hypothetical protein ACFWAY_30270 [Rhodococcus sp. NPDC059968]|uniref:hypothetical protein n=1 Tax=Rhodococcus sp. NPDC059968 TaxID=3347017 RepID=UPI00366FCD4F